MVRGKRRNFEIIGNNYTIKSNEIEIHLQLIDAIVKFERETELS